MILETFASQAFEVFQDYFSDINVWRNILYFYITIKCYFIHNSWNYTESSTTKNLVGAALQSSRLLVTVDDEWTVNILDLKFKRPHASSPGVGYGIRF